MYKNQNTNEMKQITYVVDARCETRMFSKERMVLSYCQSVCVILVFQYILCSLIWYLTIYTKFLLARVINPHVKFTVCTIRIITKHLTKCFVISATLQCVSICIHTLYVPVGVLYMYVYHLVHKNAVGVIPYGKKLWRIQQITSNSPSQFLQLSMELHMATHYPWQNI